jgi:N-acetylmuramoyl-L-alanine amidase
MRRSVERETKELIEHLHSRRRRRRRSRVLLAGIGAAVILAAIVAGTVLATGSSSGRPDATTAAQMGVSTTTRSTTTTTSRPVNTNPVPTERPPVTEQPTSTAGGQTPAILTPGVTSGSTTSTSDRLAGKVVVIDPGHQAHADSGLEPIGPGSSEKKAKVSSGTASPTTRTPESLVALEVGLRLRDALQALGIQVVMTRTAQDVDISNSQRAKIANQAHADLAIRLHCDGSTDKSVHGFFTLYPASIKGWTDDIAAISKRAATIIQREAVAATGATDRGLQERSDLTGFNWSDVPDVLVEMGFMTNAAEDKLLESAAYQDKIVQGLVKGIVDFLGTT